MKIRINKTAIIALLFIFLMAGSSIAYSIIQSFGPTGYAIKLPEKNIIDYELGTREEEVLLREGKTIAKFYYVPGCLECLKQKSSLESFANLYSNQILLEEIQSNTTAGSSLIIKSYRGQKVLSNATDEETIDAFCDLMLSPPPYCAIRKVG